MAIETLERILREHPFFLGLSDDNVATAVGCAANVRFSAGEFLFRADTPANHLFLLREGDVRLETFAPGHGAIQIDTVEAGEMLGWSWLFPPHRWHFDGRALHAVRAISLDAVCLRRKCDDDPALGYLLAKRCAEVLTQRLEATQLRLIDFYASTR